MYSCSICMILYTYNIIRVHEPRMYEMIPRRWCMLIGTYYMIRVYYRESVWHEAERGRMDKFAHAEPRPRGTAVQHTAVYMYFKQKTNVWIRTTCRTALSQEQSVCRLCCWYQPNSKSLFVMCWYSCCYCCSPNALFMNLCLSGRRASMIPTQIYIRMMLYYMSIHTRYDIIWCPNIRQN